MASDNADPFHSRATLKNGLEVVVRVIRPTDRDRLGRAFRGLKRETVYTRFFRYVDEPTEAQLKRATEFDPEREMALVVTTGDPDETIIAGGRYIVSTQDRSRAEIAFLVEEDYQGLGIARLLLRTLADIGRSRGLATFEAEVLSENASMLRVFSRSGMSMRQRREGGVVHAELSL